jgi:predicted nuclease of predicted toxin-antitoxin system
VRFLVDECAGPALAAWLRAQGHATVSIYDESPGISDDEVVARAFAEDRILITSDKGFGDRIFRRRQPHRGVVLLRLRDEKAAVKIETVRRFLEHHADSLGGQFVVVTERHVRFARG